MKRITCAVSLLAAAGAAFGQCNIRRDNVPDLDQRRTALPNNGSMYCFPTAAVNWMAYIANSGYPQLMGVPGPRDWQNTSYDLVSARLVEMGLFMSTSPTGGTTSGNARHGIAVYTGVRGAPYFTVSTSHGEITPLNLYLHMLGGGLLNICYGRYRPHPDFGTYYRDGGHCVTLTGVFGACGPTPLVVFRDPATDNQNLVAQSAFLSTLSAALRVTMPTSLVTTISRWELVHLTGGGARRCIDSVIVIRPIVALTASAQRSGELVTLRPVLLDDSDLPAQTAVAVPGGGAITDIVLTPDGLEAIVASHAPGQLRRLWRYMIPTGEFTQAMVCESALSAAATSRFGDVYAFCDGAVWRLELHEGGDTSTHEQAPAAHPIDALAYDDARDELVGVSAAGMRLVRYTRELGTIMDSALPAVQLTGDVSLAIDEANQRYLLAGSGGPAIYELGVVPGAPSVHLVGEIALPAVQHPTGLQFNDQGNLVVIHDGGIAEFARTQDGGWEPVQGSPLAGLEAHGALAVARSRTDFVPGVHDTPGWENVLVDNEGQERPDCRADWDVNAVVNSQDISAFLTSWLAAVQGGTTAADFNDDDAVNSSDISAFLTAWLGDVTVGCW